MKEYEGIFVYIGLAGAYTSQQRVRARNLDSARKKLLAYVGDRSLESLEIKEVSL